MRKNIDFIVTFKSTISTFNKKFLIAIFFILNCFSVYSQNTFDKSLNEVSADIAGKLGQKNKQKIVVLYVTDINKAQTVAGKYIADVISVNIVNDQGNFQVFDRENLSGIVEAKKMMAEGYIDADKAKELGRLLAVDAIVIGNYTVLTTTLKLTLKALDVNTGFVIAATMKDLPITPDAGALLGITLGTGDNNANKGFNSRPLNSNESYNNQETVNKDCAEKKVGDYCFTNRTTKKVKITIGYLGGNFHELTIEPNETQCLYNFKSGNINFRIYSDLFNGPRTGEILVEQCKSKTYLIR